LGYIAGKIPRQREREREIASRNAEKFLYTGLIIIFETASHPLRLTFYLILIIK
jgi:hypothetical protein